MYAQMWAEKFSDSNGTHIWIRHSSTRLSSITGQYYDRIQMLIHRGWLEQPRRGVLRLLRQPDETGSFSGEHASRWDLRLEAEVLEVYRQMWNGRVMSSDGDTIWVQQAGDYCGMGEVRYKRKLIPALKDRNWIVRAGKQTYRLLRQMETGTIAPPVPASPSLLESDCRYERAYAEIWNSCYVSATGEYWWLRPKQKNSGDNRGFWETAIAVLEGRGWMVKTQQAIYRLLHIPE